ncbi:hypothetical protein [Thomasclavelia spiroformis]|uniref:hypothetical protein n=1 Tax=Thomasclavelia spiroformis TaxID=29348 RepID=UPI00242A5D53|nr:hypothetical protein [Thomasclavelia spiroformis]
MANEKHISLDLLKQFATGFKGKFDALLNNKVDKVAGKQLSTEDYTTAEKSKLATLEPLTIKSIKVNNSALTPDGSKAVNIDLTKYAIKTEVTQEIAEAVSGIEGFDAQVVEELPQTGKKGILYLVANSSEEDKNAYDEYLWLTDKYEKLGTRSIDLSQYALKSEVPTKVSQLTNDSGFQTSAQVGTIVDSKIAGKADKTYVDTELGKKANTSHTHTKAQITDMPTKLSQFTNDSGFQTAANVDTKLADYAKKTDIASVYKYKGSKANYAALPTSGNTVGDVWNVEAVDSAHGIKAGDNVAWDGTKWDVLAGTIDTAGFATKTELGNKVDKVTGKGLSTNDFTNEYKTKLDNLENVTIDFATTGDIDNIITEVFG